MFLATTRTWVGLGIYILKSQYLFILIYYISQRSGG